MRHRFTFNPHSAVSPREKDVVFRSLHVESSLLGGLHPTNSSKSVNQTAEYGLHTLLYGIFLHSFAFPKRER